MTVKEAFGEQVIGNQSYKTPGRSNFLIVKPVNNMGKLSFGDQHVFGIGTLVYLVKCIKQDISNTTQGFQKRWTRKIKQCFSKSVLDNRAKKEKKEQWSIAFFSNSNYEHDLIRRRCAIRFVLYVFGVPQKHIEA